MNKCTFKCTSLVRKLTYKQYFQVRAATVFALGTYVSCDKDRSEHAMNVDKSIAITLLNTVATDMSPMVREVITNN